MKHTAETSSQSDAVTFSYIWNLGAVCMYHRLGHVQMDDDGDELGDDGELGFSPGSFRPGRVVWAKVDGHEWWPAKVTLRCQHLHGAACAAHSVVGQLPML